MAQIGTLSVQFKSSAKVLEKTLASLTSQLNKFHAATNNTSLVRVVNETKQLGVAAEKAAKKTGNFGSSLMRIAKYRLLRTILKEITQAFREGVTNLYEYSTALNSTDAAANKSTMDQYASSLLYLKNAAGAAAGPLLQALLPVVQQLVDWFVAGANAVNQFISALQGKTTFTKAVYNMAEFGEQTEKAGAAAKELKKTIFGWDELNVLQDNKPSGGGAAASMPDYSGMFEEAEIGTGFQKVADFLKDTFGWFFDAVKWLWDNKIIQGIGAAFGAWKIADGVLNFFSKYLGSGVGGVVGGLVLTIAGISLQKGAASDIVNDGLNIENGITTLIGGAFTAAGIHAVVTALGVSGPIGWAIGIGAALAVEIYELNVALDEKRKANFNVTEIGQELLSIEADLEEQAQLNLDLEARINSISAEIDDETIGKIEEAKRLIDEIFSLDGVENKTPEMIQLIKDKIDALNGLGLPGVLLSFNEAAGYVNETKDAITGVINELLRQYQIEANKEALVEAYGAQQEAARGVNSAYEKQKQLQKNLAASSQKMVDLTNKYKANESELLRLQTIRSSYTEDRYDEMYGVGSFGRAMEKLDGLIDEQNNYSEQMREVETQTARYAADVRMANANLNTAIGLYESASGKVDTLEGDLSTLTGTQVKSNASTKLLTTSTNEMKTSMENLDTAFGEFEDGNYDGAIDKLKTSTSGAKAELSDMRQKVVNLRSTTDVFGNQIDKYGNTIDTATGKTKNFGTVVKNVDGNLVNAKGDVIQLHDSMQKLVSMRSENNGASGITKEVADNLKNARDYAKTLYTNLTNVEGVKMTTFVSKLIEARDALYNAKVYAYNLYDGLNKASKYKLRKMDEYALNNAYVEYDPTFTYASGGWPSAGELFVAREAGPEMVGTINGSTAVATNGDIVAAVSQGVAQAVAGVMGSGSGDMNISIQVGEYELANAVVSALNAQTRRIGYSQLEGI